MSINNPDFENYLGQMYPAELEIKDTTESNTSASCLNLLLSIGRDGQLPTSLYDKHDDFNFHITNFSFLSSNIPYSPAYGDFISHLIRYAGACPSYKCFILRAARQSSKLVRQRYVRERLKSSLSLLLRTPGAFVQICWDHFLLNLSCFRTLNFEHPSIILFYCTVLSKVFKTPLYISADAAHFVSERTVIQKIAGSSLLCTTIFLQTMFACWHTSLHVKAHNQNDWSVTNQI